MAAVNNQERRAGVTAQREPRLLWSPVILGVFWRESEMMDWLIQPLAQLRSDS